MRRMGMVAIAVTIATLCGLVVGVGPAGAAPNDREVVHETMDAEFHYVGLEQAVIDICGVENALDVIFRTTSRTKLFFEDGALVRVIEVRSHNVVETVSRASGASISTAASGTHHVDIGVGANGRDVVKVTGLVAQFRIPGMGVVALEAGQVIIEAYGPTDPNPLVIDVVGRSDSFSPAICDVAAYLAAQ